MVKGVVLVEYTDQGRRTIKDSPDRVEASKAEAAKLGIHVKDLFYTPGGPHDALIYRSGRPRTYTEVHG